MKKIAYLLFALGCQAAVSAHAGVEFATPKEAEAMVGKAVAALKANKDKTITEVNAKDPKWIDRDLYVTIYDMQGNALAHGMNAKMAGKNMLELRDGHGKRHIAERMELAKTKDKFWHDFSFADPVTKKVLPKSMYCEKAIETVVCAGVYKRD